MPKKFVINNIFGLQVFQVLRFTAFLVISIIFTRSELSKNDIGDFELLLFFGSAVTYFWITGIIQSLLPLFNNSKSFSNRDKTKKKSPELFNAFIVIMAVSLVLFIIGLFIKDYIDVYKGGHPLPYALPLLFYILLSSPACLVEYIYLLFNKSKHILLYGLVSFTLQVLMVVLPVWFGWGVEAGIWGIVVISALRFAWLMVLLKQYTIRKISLPFIKEHVMLALPLVVSSLLSGSAQYIDGIIVSAKFSPEKFAIFRYGAKEMPLLSTLASGLNNAMLTQFNTIEKIRFGLLTLKKRSLRLMHILFPISILLLFFSDVIFKGLFTSSFFQSSDIFMVYILLIISKLVFPQTILIGLKKNRIVMWASIIEIFLNVVLSLLMIPTYGLVGVAVATVIIYIVEKFILIAYNYYKLGIKPNEYIPVVWYLSYSVIIVVIFILIDHRILVLRM